MNDIRSPGIASPLLEHCPESLPATWYYDPAHYERELKAIWSRHWISAGRAATMAGPFIGRAGLPRSPRNPLL